MDGLKILVLVSRTASWSSTSYLIVRFCYRVVYTKQVLPLPQYTLKDLAAHCYCGSCVTRGLFFAFYHDFLTTYLGDKVHNASNNH